MQHRNCCRTTVGTRLRPKWRSIRREPNIFGLIIGHDPYRDERTSDPNAIRGGDGGRMVCGGASEFVEWLTIATAYRDADYVKFMHEPATTWRCWSDRQLR